MSNSTRKWLRGAIEILIHGGASAVTSALVGWKMSMTWTEWKTLVVSAFIANGGIRFCQYFVNNPMPVDNSTSISLNPFTKVQPINPTSTVPDNVSLPAVPQKP